MSKIFYFLLKYLATCNNLTWKIFRVIISLEQLFDAFKLFYSLFFGSYLQEMEWEPQMPMVRRHTTVWSQKVPIMSKTKFGKSFSDMETFYSSSFKTLKHRKNFFCYFLIFVPMIVWES